MRQVESVERKDGRVFFVPPGINGPHGKCDVVGTHFHAGEFDDFFVALGEEQQAFLRASAGNFQMSLSAFAIQFGVPSKTNSTERGAE